MHLLAGLGNPGREYAATRHNIGFLFIDYLARRFGIPLKSEKKWEAELGRGVLWDRPLLLVKPQTYMNRSGLAVARIAHFYQIPPAEVVIVHDEIDLPFMRTRMAVDRGPGGHNGVRSVIEHLGSREFVRFRVGVGRPAGPIEAADYVLSRFSAPEEQQLAELFPRLEEGLRLLLQDGPTAAMNFLNAP